MAGECAHRLCLSKVIQFDHLTETGRVNGVGVDCENAPATSDHARQREGPRSHARPDIDHGVARLRCVVKAANVARQRFEASWRIGDHGSMHQDSVGVTMDPMTPVVGDATQAARSQGHEGGAAPPEQPARSRRVERLAHHLSNLDHAFACLLRNPWPVTFFGVWSREQRLPIGDRLAVPPCPAVPMGEFVWVWPNLSWTDAYSRVTIQR